jgi:hypothetical protein
MGLRVIAVREHVGQGRPAGVEAVFAPATLDEMLQQSDYVVLAAPLLVATRELIDAQRLRYETRSGRQAGRKLTTASCYSFRVGPFSPQMDSGARKRKSWNPGSSLSIN